MGFANPCLDFPAYLKSERDETLILRHMLCGLVRKAKGGTSRETKRALCLTCFNFAYYAEVTLSKCAFAALISKYLENNMGKSEKRFQINFSTNFKDLY